MKKAFTLIELLIVVLIIGILSAVALPQYQVAVMKTKFMNMRSVARSYVRAAEAYHLETNEWATSFSVLAVGTPGGTERVSSSHSNACYTADQMWCCILENKDGYQSAGITCGSADHQIGYEYQFVNNSEYCYAKPDNNPAIQMCKSVTGKSAGGTTNFPSPTGHLVGYKYYTF